MPDEDQIKVRETHAHGAPEPFAFRHYAAGPERDTAKEFYELWEDLSWLRDGPEKQQFKVALLVARDAAMHVARSMV